MKILYINAVCGVGSTGRIVLDLMKQAREQGHSVKVACSSIEPIRGVECDETIIVGSKLDYYIHNALSRITDHEGLYSKQATKRLIKQIRAFDPDIVHLHNLHGHWINYEILFQYLAKENKKVIWTLHDCWAFTGHCSHFVFRKCEQWKTHCSACRGLRAYPKCYGPGDVSRNFERKKTAFTSVRDMTIVTPSDWLKMLADMSFLRNYPIEVVHNKIDLSIFKPTTSSFREEHDLCNKTIVLGVANVWNKWKGLDDFLALSQLMDNSYAFVIVGLTKEQIRLLPEGAIGIERTQSASELAAIYSTADVFVNLTYQDTFPTVNLEALACGTPVVSYRTGGSCEAFDDRTGVSVAQGELNEVPHAIEKALMLKREDILDKSNKFSKFGDYSFLYD